MTRYGQVQIQAMSGRNRERWRWVPPDDLTPELPPDFHVEFECITGDGIRRFAPADGYKVFVQQAFLAGIELLARDRHLDGDRRHSYRAMKLVYDRVRRMHEYRDRRFGSSRDLYVRQRGRGGEIDHSILPEHLGLRADGSGRRWSPSKLISEGRRRAAADGKSAITTSSAISYGLLAAAERNPLCSDQAWIPRLVRNSLFDLADASSRNCPADLAGVAERVLLALQEHLPDSRQRFNAWYDGPKSNFFKSIANWSLRSEGKLSQAEARDGFLLLGWQSYEYMAECVSYFMQAFAKGLTVRLNPNERELLAHMYQPQPCFGGLSLVLLLDRAQILAPIIPRLWAEPGNQELIAVLHRILSYYDEMARTRRMADQRFKRKAARSVPQLELTNWGAMERPDSSEPSRLTGLLEQAIERRQLGCSRCDRNPRIDSSHSREGEAVHVELTCPQHGYFGQAEIPFAEIRELGREEDRPPRNQPRRRPR